MIRPATLLDIPLLIDLIYELAQYERLADTVTLDAGRLTDHLFGPRPCVEALIAESTNSPAGFALFFTNYSTFQCLPGLYLEDLFVRPAFRGLGLGRELFLTLARIAVERGYGRMEWAVLDWNEPAIGFYKSMGANPLDDWTKYRLTGNELACAAQLSADADRTSD